MQSNYTQPPLNLHQPKLDYPQSHRLGACQIKPNIAPTPQLLDLPNHILQHIFKLLNDPKSLVCASITSQTCKQLFDNLKGMVFKPEVITKISKLIPYSPRPIYKIKIHELADLVVSLEEPDEATGGYEKQKKCFLALIKNIDLDKRNITAHNALTEIYNQKNTVNTVGTGNDQVKETERAQFLVHACAEHGIDLNFQANNMRIIDLLLKTIDWKGDNNTSTVNAFFSCARNLTIQALDNAETKNRKEQLQHELIVGIMKHDAPQGLVPAQILSSEIDPYTLNYEIGQPSTTISKLLNLGLKLNAKNSAEQTPEQYFTAQQDHVRASKLAKLQVEIGVAA